MCSAGADSSSVWVCQTVWSLIGGTTSESETARVSKCSHNGRLSSHPHSNAKTVVERRPASWDCALKEWSGSSAIPHGHLAGLIEEGGRGSSAPWANQRHMHEEKRHEWNVCLGFYGSLQAVTPAWEHFTPLLSLQTRGPCWQPDL